MANSKISRTYLAETHLGKMYVVVTFKEGLPDGVFAYSESSERHPVNCFNAEVEAIGRALHTGLDFCRKRDRKKLIVKFIEELQDIQCEQHWFQGRQVKSVADGIAWCLERALKEGAPNV